MAAMLLASLALGVVYNSASPLGVRGASGTGLASKQHPPATETAAGVRSTKATEPVPTAKPRSGYHNQTLAVSFNGANSAAAKAPLPDSHIHNSPLPNSPLPNAPAVNAVAAAKPAFAELTWPETKALMAAGKGVLIDARIAANYEAEHIPGAVSLPANSSSEDIAAFLKRHPKDTPFIIYCGSSKCPMSHTLAGALVNQHGCTNVRIMPGGYVEYRTAMAQEGAK